MILGKRKNLKKQPKGAALVEYVVLTGLIGVVSISFVMQLGERVNNTFETVETSLLENGVAGVAAEAGEPSVSAPTPPSFIPPANTCETLTGPGPLAASSFPAATCFTYSSPSNEDFTFAADERIIYMDGYNLANPEPRVNGDAGDNMVGVVKTQNGFFEFFGGDGNDVIVADGWSSSEVEILNFGGGDYEVAFFDGMDFFSSTYTNIIAINGVESIVLSDTTISEADYDDYDPLIIGDGPGLGGPGSSCPIGSGGPGTTQTITIGPSGSPEINVAMGDGDDVLNIYYTSNSDMSGGAQNNINIDLGCGENRVNFYNFEYVDSRPYSDDTVVQFTMNQDFEPSYTNVTIGNNDGFGGAFLIEGIAEFYDDGTEVFPSADDMFLD